MSERKEQKKIAVADLIVGYEGKSVLANINFCVHPGEILTLIGPNGSGKSTLLKSITRQLQTIAGNVWVDGEEVEKITDTALAKKMSMVMTERIAPELMTCREVVETGRYPYTGRFGILGDEDKQKVEEALRRLHALDVADKLFTKISDGQRQRVMPARLRSVLSFPAPGCAAFSSSTPFPSVTVPIPGFLLLLPLHKDHG